MFMHAHARHIHAVHGLAVDAHAAQAHVVSVHVHAQPVHAHVVSSMLFPDSQRHMHSVIRVGILQKCTVTRKLPLIYNSNMSQLPL
jgi:hypothetical protein